MQKKHIEATFMPLHNAYQSEAGASKHKVQFQSTVLKFSKMVV